jgi:hypothetical protein
MNGTGTPYLLSACEEQTTPSANGCRNCFDTHNDGYEYAEGKDNNQRTDITHKINKRRRILGERGQSTLLELTTHELVFLAFY